MNVELKNLVTCNTYRDGGSLEGIWETTENQEWIITLRVEGEWTSQHFDNRHFKLFAHKLNDTQNRSPVTKNSPQQLEMSEILQRWMNANSITLSGLKTETKNDDCLYDLLDALNRGNY